MKNKEKYQPKTNEVLDLHYTEEEGQSCFQGSFDECIDYVQTQSPHFMYKIVPIVEEK